MNNISISVVDSNNNNSFHCKLLVDGKDAGFLYLSDEQLNFIARALKTECLDNGVNFSLENPFDISADEFDEE